MVDFRKWRRLAAAASIALIANAGITSAAPISGYLNVVQNNTTNDNTSVTITVPVASPGFGAAAGTSDSNGDYVLASNLTSANGVLITSVRSNGTGAAGTSFNSAPYISGTKYVISMNKLSGTEGDANVAAAYFDYASYLGGNFTGAATNVIGNTAVNTTWQGNSNVVVGTHLVPGATTATPPVQFTTVNFTLLTAPTTGTAATSSKGILLVNDFSNGTQSFAASHANADGTFTVYSEDTTGPTNEQFPLSMVYVPLNDPNVAAMGRIDGNGATLLGSGNFTVTQNTTTKQYLLKITGQTDTTGTLIVSGESIVGQNDADNVLDYVWSATDGGWLVQSSDLPSGGAQALAAGSPAFDFAFLPVPEPSSLGLLAAGTLLFLRRRRRVDVSN